MLLFSRVNEAALPLWTTCLSLR